ncbi:MAG: hypothetical protein H2038_10945 [Brevundimonas sp.]|uniref:hypothetical protein n=1 Tax=Brevundimonas sp. TaxID=1871086 RepID=UPI00179DF949|nr:hypothetical protein [Brevundimonas sp.]MBA4805157.1 hypothetical protein [Brevundimonas sp.]
MRLLLPVIAGLALAGCAPVGTGGEASGHMTAATGQCFRASQIHTFSTPDDSTYVRSNQGYVYRLSGPGACFGRGVTSLSLEPTGGVGERICVGEEARVRVVRTDTFPLTCIARVEGPITDSSVSGLPARR